MAASTETKLTNYHKARFHHSLHKPVPEFKVETLYAYQLGVLSAAHAAHGVTNKWQGIWVIPMADSDEIHAIWVTPHDFDYKYPVKVRWGLLPNNATSASTITTTFDAVDTNGDADADGSDAAGDGATAFTDTIPAIVAADTTANVPFWSKWGKINAQTADWDVLFIKLVSSGNSSADRLRVFCMQVGYTPLAA